MGYHEIDPVSIRHSILQAACIKIHYTCGLPEPGDYMRRTETQIRLKFKGKAYGEEDLLSIQHKRNRKVKNPKKYCNTSTTPSQNLEESSKNNWEVCIICKVDSSYE